MLLVAMVELAANMHEVVANMHAIHHMPSQGSPLASHGHWHVCIMHRAPCNTTHTPPALGRRWARMHAMHHHMPSYGSPLGARTHAMHHHMSSYGSPLAVYPCCMYNLPLSSSVS
eukprot:m.46715 g.46715  ORF g.46715 m.46715 type:complete len:115 (-) comp6795_c0_seq1:477-821(-)